MALIFGENLPARMDVKTLSRRSKLMNAEGYHLIYNRPFVGTDVKRETPIPCFAGLCIAFLVYTRAARERFCPAVGNREFSIGYVYNHHTWGLFSTTWNDGRWNGYNEKDHNGFPANTYHYVYYYFKDDQTLHGRIDDIDLADDSQKRNVAKTHQLIYLGYTSEYHDALNLEVHWVLWNGVDNQRGDPSKSLIATLWTKSLSSFNTVKLTNDVFELRTGSVITVFGKYKKSSKGNNRYEIGVMVKNSQSDKQGWAWLSGHNDPNRLYVIIITITELGAYVQTYNGLAHVYSQNVHSNSKSIAQCELYNLQPEKIYVETMGQELP
ncbi:uncharacterized protein LOC144109462 [Amblyomma americanum]